MNQLIALTIAFGIPCATLVIILFILCYSENNGCKHSWIVLSKEYKPSPVERLLKLGFRRYRTDGDFSLASSSCLASDSSNLERNPLMIWLPSLSNTKGTFIHILYCSTCGKLKHYVDEV